MRSDDPSSCDDSKKDEEPKTPADDHRHGDPPLRQAELPLNELLVLLAVYAVLLALLPVETLKSQPGTKATTVTVLYAFAFSVVIWLKLQQPRITKGYTLISICQFLMIRLVFTAGFVCIACIVSIFIPDGLGWIVIYVSVNGTVSCILVAWDIASMFRAPVGAETLNPKP